MTTLRPFTLPDLFKFNNVNLDVLTETYGCSFYLEYLSKWPQYFSVAEAPSGKTMGYVMGKAEGEGELWHGHVTAVTVAPEFRRQGLAKLLMNALESVTSEKYNGYFVDLFVRESNSVAVGMYKAFGYERYRTVLGYYSGEENAWDMRKALARDPGKKSMVPMTRDITPEELEW
jgi:N-terminal acetyltransferase B complex catalytic subunit